MEGIIEMYSLGSAINLRCDFASSTSLAESSQEHLQPNRVRHLNEGEENEAIETSDVILTYHLPV